MLEKRPGRTAAYTVEEEGPLLAFLLAHVKGKSRNTVKNLLSRRQIQVDGKVVTRFDHPLRPGQTVSLLPPPLEREPKRPFPVLYEDGGLIAIDKPAGLLTIATDREKERTAYRMLGDALGGSGREKPLYIVHRLDRDTSGVVLFAKNEQIKCRLQEEWDDLVQERAYLAVVEGEPPKEEGTVRSWLRETSTHLVYSGPPGNGAKEAVTHYRVVGKAEGYALLRVRLDTGRKNQIRVHMKDLGCPVAGDKKYQAASDPLGRLGLHACTLSLTDPGSGVLLKLEAKPPKEFRRLFPDCGAYL